MSGLVLALLGLGTTLLVGWVALTVMFFSVDGG
jgi:hypothetical protein